MKTSTIGGNTLSFLLLTAALGFGDGPATHLASTAPLTWEEADLSTRLMDGAHRFVERQIARAPARRRAYWKYDTSSREAYEASVAANRARLREIIGVVDPRVTPIMERFGDDQNPACVAENRNYRVFQVRWPVLPGVFGEGLLVEPTSRPVAHVVVVPDADQTPEQLVGLAHGLPPEQQLARRLAENGFEVVLPVLVSREKLATDEKRLKQSDQTHREWIYRQAFHMGRHVIGYEVQKVLAAIDWFERRAGSASGHRHSSPPHRLGVIGYAEGGLIAFYAAAIDQRVDAVLVSGYFDSREDVWAEPIYRNVWGLLRRFGDAEIASLIVPRGLVVEHSQVLTIVGHKGAWRTPDFERVKNEFYSIPISEFGLRPQLIHGSGGTPVGPGSTDALGAWARQLGVKSELPTSEHLPTDRRQALDARQRQRRAMQQLEGHVQQLVRDSEHVRDRRFLFKVMPELNDRTWRTQRQYPVHSAKKFVDAACAYRRQFHEEGMGRFDPPLLPPNPRTRRIIDNNRWSAYDVVLDVYPDLIAWGVLLVPKDIQPGERRPVVVCQHGRNGIPRDVIDAGQSAYNDFAAALADRGFVTFAPHNLYRGEDRYRWLDRKANTIKATLFSLIIAQHDQILRWLGTQPFVDGDRMAFYGLSYGGETAVRVPTVLEKYCLSICSGDFNQWTRKVVATDQPFTFMKTIEWEMPYWNLGHTFDYAEMTYLMIPRPFMVERGHLDRVGRDRWVAHEYAKVRWLYAQLGLADRTQIEFFQGGHSIRGEQTFEFLHRHLRWPKR